jgi:uncharacterized membrane protein
LHFKLKKLTPKIPKETLDAWSKDPANWKWGMIYYNKQDPRLMPPKPNPAYGFTVNFANPKSVRLFLLLIAIPITVVLLVVFLASL